MSHRTPAATTALLVGLFAAVLTGCGAPTPGVIEPPAEAQPTLAPSTEPTSGADPAPAATPQCRRPGGDGTISNGEPLNVGLYDGMVDLGPRAITSVGDVNGEVHSYETVFILPPQR